MVLNLPELLSAGHLRHQRWTGSSKMAEGVERKSSPTLADRGNIQVGECRTQNALGWKIRRQGVRVNTSNRLCDLECVECRLHTSTPESGHLDQAMEMVQSMPFQAHSVVWRCFLAACRKWRNVELGLLAFEFAVTWDKHDTAAYFSKANIYAAPERWEDAKEVQALRRKMPAWKRLGQSNCTDQIGTGQNEHTKGKDKCGELQDLGMEKRGGASFIGEGARQASAYVKASGGSMEGVSTDSEFRNQSPENAFAHISDSYSWTSLIQQYTKSGQGRLALGVYVEMRRCGVNPSSYSIVAALKACSMIRDLKAAKQIHTDVISNGFQSHVYVGTMLVDVYAKCGSLVDARQVFEKMPRRDVVSWNAMIVGHAQNQEGEEALQLYGRMQQEGVIPNDRTFVGALKACSSLATLDEDDKGDREQAKKWCLNEVRAIHTDVVKGKFESDVFVGNMLVDAYAKCGSLFDARGVFETIPCRNVISWTAMIFAYAHMEEGEVALELYAQMQQEGVVPDDRAFVGVLKACSVVITLEEANKGDGIAVRKRCLEHVRSIHSDVVRLKYQSDAFVVTMLLDVYAKCGSLVDARAVFEKLHRPSVASWNAIILGYAEMEEGEEALKLFERMQLEGFIPEERTFVGALKACGVLAALEKGKEIHAQISKKGFKACDLFVLNTLIDMYGRCGSMVDAQLVFDRMGARDLVTWSALIAGYARQGETETVFECFHQMRETGVQPNGITFLSVLTVCNHAGLVDKGKKYFKDMAEHYGISPSMEHYICMVGLLGRAGQLETAMEMVTAMPFQPDGGVWKTLLGACRKWSSMELGIQAFEGAVNLDIQDASAYVLMCNIYTDACMFENAREIQGMKEKMRAWKQPGQSWWTDIDGIVNAFVVGDQDHPESHHTYAKLGDLFARLQEEGYVLHRDSVLRQRPEDDEDNSLYG